MNIRTQSLLRKYAPHIKNRQQLADAMDVRYGVADKFWSGTLKQLQMDMLKRFVWELVPHPGEFTLGEFFELPGTQRSKRYEPPYPEICSPEIAPRARLRTPELAEAAGIKSKYQLWKVCGFPHITAATALWHDPKRMSLENLERLIVGLKLDPATTSLAELFDFGLPKDEV